MFSTFYFDRVTCLLVVQQTLQLMYNSSASIISKKKIDKLHCLCTLIPEKVVTTFAFVILHVAIS